MGLVRAGGTTVLPGVVDALTGRLAEEAGFRAGYITGAGVANTTLGLPDVGLLTFDGMLTQAMRITAVTSIPLIVDGDTGYGGPTSARHAVQEFERIGIAGMQIEDQALPKRCGHFEGKSLVATADMQMKIAAMAQGRHDPDFLIIARTDARAVEGIDSAIARMRAYRDAGADVLFVEAPVDMDEIRTVTEELAGMPVLLNVVEGGKTPAVTASEAAELGVTFLLHANFLLRTMVKAAQGALEHLHRTGETASVADTYVTWQERQRVLGLPALDAWEDDLSKTWQPDEAREDT
ncbi:MAG: isocitrate lyase/PEP mutase family protein [Actinomycetota bacterium]